MTPLPSRPPRTYQDGALSHAVTSELGRLQALETARDATTIDLIERLEPRRDWHCLELGAGAGSIARWLATRCPSARSPPPTSTPASCPATCPRTCTSYATT